MESEVVERFGEATGYIHAQFNRSRIFIAVSKELGHIVCLMPFDAISALTEGASTPDFWQRVNDRMDDSAYKIACWARSQNIVEDYCRF